MNTATKHSAIERHLSSAFPCSTITQKHNFDRGTQTFKICSQDHTLLLKISNEFVDDNSIDEIFRQFDLWDLTKNLAREIELGLLVTQCGLETFTRES